MIIEEDLFVKHRIIHPDTPAGQKIHAFFLAQAKALAGRYIDFDKTPATFLLSDTDEPNAFFMPVYDPEKRPRDDDYYTIRYIRNPFPNPVICFSRGLVDMADNLDELDFVEGHELTHWLMRMKGIKHNSKGEEEIGDLHAVDLVYDAGNDPKQALRMSDKISAHIHQNEKDKKDRKKAHRRKDGREEKEEGMDWSTILDVHMTDANRRAGIEASLTRLSHLIDDRTATPLDKSVLTVTYTDPVDEYLKAHNYQDKKALGKLKILVDCIDSISIHVSPEEYFQARMAQLNKENRGRHDYETADRKKRLQECIDGGYSNYYHGPTIPKKYQQKIAELAENVIADVIAERRIKGNQSKPALVNTKNLTVYLLNKGHQHIGTHGHPARDDLNYFDASSILYSYFYALFRSHERRWRKNGIKEPSVQPSQTERGIQTQKQRIRVTKSAATFVAASEELARLRTIQSIATSVREGDPENGYREKLRNLSGIITIGIGAPEDPPIYRTPKCGKHVPWENLVKLAQANEEVKPAVIKFLRTCRIQDYRLTHGLPLIQIGGERTCYEVDNSGVVINDKILHYQVDFAANRDIILDSYKYIQDYLAAEDDLIDATIATAVGSKTPAFSSYTSTTERFNDHSIGQNNIYGFIAAFNALPAEAGQERRSVHEGYAADNKKVYALIPKKHWKESPPSGFSADGNPTFNNDLYDVDNPIFQQHFGSDFDARLAEKRAARQEKMFAATLTIITNLVRIWRAVSPRVDALKAEIEAQRQSLWSNGNYNEQSWERIREIEKTLEPLSKRKRQAEILCYNMLLSAINDRLEWYNLQRLSSSQKKTLAEMVVQDKKHVFTQIFDAERYEQFCDTLNILEQQTTEVLLGNIALIPAMQVVATNYGYHHATTREELSAFVHENEGDRYSNARRGYAWHLHVFDTLQYLQSASNIDVRSMLVALQRIEAQPSGNRGSDLAPLVEARYKNYRKFMKESPLVTLMCRAIDTPDNYKDLPFDAILETIDVMIPAQQQIRDALKSYKPGKNYYDHPVEYLLPEHQELLDTIERNIYNLTRRAESLALQDNDRVAGLRNIHRLYHDKSETSMFDKKRSAYTDKLNKDESRLTAISILSKQPIFWPDDTLEHIQAYAFAKRTFLDDKKYEDAILSTILDKVEALPSGKKKRQCIRTLLDANLRAPYPETRERLYDIYTRETLAHLGKDDCSKAYQRRLAACLKALNEQPSPPWDDCRKHKHKDSVLSNTVAIADKYLLLRKLADAVVSQEQTSYMMKEACQITLNSDDMIKSYLYGVGVDAITEESDRDADMAKNFIRFFNSKGEKADCQEISDHIRKSLTKRLANRPDALESALRKTSPTNCGILYENFWSAPLEARAFIIARILKSAVKDETVSGGDTHNTTMSWERVFDVVMDNIIRPDDVSVEAKYARDIMHSYIKSRSDYERVLILSAMMVANRNIGSDAGNIGKALRLFLENMGPAEIKLGQAIASHPDTPESIRKELQYLKSAANIPPRWTIYDWIRAENIPEEFWKNVYLGEIMGSASYYTSVALGEYDVLRILRPEAREKATKGFRVIRSTVDDLKEKQETSELSYRDLTDAVQEMVIQAGRMSEIETDHTLGQEQYESAKELYNGVTLECGAKTFTLKVMDWRAKGQNWIIMQRAKGITYNALPENTSEEIAYKKQFAKSYIVLEIINILSGGKFDHDRHGAQLSIDPSTNAVGLYDTGAMALQIPSTEEKHILGQIIYDAGMTGDNFFSAFSNSLSKRIEKLHREGKDTQYLVEVKKGFLALGDFFRILDADDIQDILPSINIAADLSPDVQAGITANMSSFENQQWQALLAMAHMRKRTEITIIRATNAANDTAPIQVATVTVLPTTQQKASWLQNVFGENHGGKPPANTSNYIPDRPSYVYADRHARIA